MNYKEFAQSLNSKIENAYIFVGDSFLVQKSLDVLKQKLDIVSQLDISIFDNENFSAKQIVQACEQMSFFNNKRILLVKNISSLTESDKKYLNDYIKNPNPLSILLLIDNNANGVFGGIKCQNVDLKTLSDFELIELCESISIKHNKKIDRNACLYLIECCLRNISKIEMEMQKLCDYVSDSLIEKKDVELLVHKDEEIIVFELTTALSQKNADKSTTILSKLIGKADQNSKLFSLISSNFRRMFLCSISNKSKQELSNLLGVKEFAISKLLEQAKIFSPKKLKIICEFINECEYYIKSGQMAQDNCLYYLIFKILYI